MEEKQCRPRELDVHKICFIIPVTDMKKFHEAQGYIEKLTVPAGFQVEILALSAYRSMAESYNEAMLRKNAKYKVYMHQDVGIIHREFIVRLVDLFCAHAEIGIAGVVGSAELPESGVWWEAKQLLGAIYDDHQGKMAPYIYSSSAALYQQAGALDVRGDGLCLGLVLARHRRHERRHRAGRAEAAERPAPHRAGGRAGDPHDGLRAEPLPL